jgi:hypothetical protein
LTFLKFKDRYIEFKYIFKSNKLRYGFKTWVTENYQNMGNTFILKIGQLTKEIGHVMEGGACRELPILSCRTPQTKNDFCGPEPAISGFFYALC